MSIEFRCPACNKLLRTPDDTAGQQVKCPACSTPLTIPAISIVADDAGGGFPPPPPPRGGGVDPGDIPGVFPNFPGGSPTSASRTGPPWERDGASLGSFIATLREAYLAMGEHFARMRRTGGYLKPLGYLIVTNLLALTVTFLLESLMFSADVSAKALLGPLGETSVERWQAIGGGGMGLGGLLCSGLVFTPLAAVLSALLGSGILHFCLKMVGGATQPFETTYRTFCYGAGSAGLLQFVPFCGRLIWVIGLLVFLVRGLSAMHEISTAKALLATLPPFLVCGICGCVGMVFGGGAG
ncbi:MAG: YIP1 family protein [Pirellulales bacterium]|nr:YIP1 family protein [Pirellulales bacterium]